MTTKESAVSVQSADIELLLDRLVIAAKKRHDDGLELFAGMRFDDFLKSVKELGATVVDLHRKGVDLAHTAMAADYLSRALQMQIRDSVDLVTVEPGGSA